MATEQTITQSNAANAIFTITDFSFIDSIDVKVSVTPSGGTTDLKTAGVHYNIVGNTVTFTTGNLPPLNAVVMLYRDTVLTSAKATYHSGSTIRAEDLNDNQNQFLYSLEEKYSGVVIKNAYEAQSNTNAYTDTEKTKLSGIDTGAKDDQTGAEIKTAYEAEANTNAFTDAEKTKLSGLDSSNYLAASHAASGVTSTKITNWDTAYGWGKHASAGYLTSITIADDSITEVKLDIHNNPSGTDKVLGYTSNGLEWVSQSGGGGGIALSDISVTSASAGTAALSYNNSSGVFSYTPPDLSGYSVTSHNHDSSYATSSHNHNSSYIALTGGTFTGSVTFEDAINENVYECTGTELEPNNGTIQYKTLGSNTTLTESIAAGQSMLLMVADGSSYTVTWPTMTWVSGSAPTLATSGYSCIELWKISTTLYGCHIGDVA